MPETNRWGSYLEGELAVQRLAGVGRKGLKAGQMYHAGMPAGSPEVFAASTTRGVGDHRRRRMLVGVSPLRPAGFSADIDDGLCKSTATVIRTILCWLIECSTRR